MILTVSFLGIPVPSPISLKKIIQQTLKSVFKSMMDLCLQESYEATAYIFCRESTKNSSTQKYLHKKLVYEYTKIIQQKYRKKERLQTATLHV